MILANMLKSNVAPVRSAFSTSFIQTNVPIGSVETVITGADIGVDHPSRTVVFAIYANDSNSFSLLDVTIGGVNATRVAHTTNGNIFVSFYSASVSGETADVTVRFSSAFPGGIGIVSGGLWSIWGSSNSPTNTYSTNADPAYVTASAPNGAITIGAVGSGAVGSEPSIAWNNMSQDFKQWNSAAFSAARKNGGMTGLQIGGDFSATTVGGRCALYTVWR